MHARRAAERRLVAQEVTPVRTHRIFDDRAAQGTRWTGQVVAHIGLEVVVPAPGEGRVCTPERDVLLDGGERAVEALDRRAEDRLERGVDVEVWRIRTRTPSPSPGGPV